MRRFRPYVVPFVLAGCVLVAGIWQVMYRMSRRPFAPFEFTAADLEGFMLHMPGWTVDALPVDPRDPTAPNLFSFLLHHRDGRTFGLRLAHGYNMPMCLKIKEYSVEEFFPASLDPPYPMQFWWVTSSAGDESVWLTTMLRASDFQPTAVDVREMAFPRVDIPDDPRWVPRGLTWEALRRNPVGEIRAIVRARWNASRADWLTFLGLRQPAWASDELLTYIAIAPFLPPEPAARAALLRELAALHARGLEQLQAWKKE